MSYLRQLKEVAGSKELNLSSMHDVLQQIGEKYVCNDVELKAQTERVMKKFLTDRTYQCIQELNSILKVEFQG
jgi:hypothetical protein